MNRQKKILTASGIVILVLVFGILAVHFGGISRLNGVQSGGLILSASQTQFLSNDPTIGGQAWLVNFVQNGQGQYLQGFASASEITDGTKTATKDLSVTISQTPQVCSYAISSRGDTVYNLQVKYTGAFFTFSGCQGSCPAPSFSSCKPINLGVQYEAYCYTKTQSGIVGNVGTPTLQFSSDIITTIGGVNYKGTISNIGATSVSLGDGSVQASWAGNLVSGEQCPISNTEDIIGMYKSGQWITTSNSAYTSYASYDQTGLSDCINNRYLKGLATPQDCTSEYNNHANEALAQKSFIAIGGETATQMGTLSNGKVAITLGKSIQFPSIAMRIKASTLGVFIPVTKPKIISSSSQCFETGQNGFVVVQVQNTGTVAGSISTSLICGDGFSLTGTTDRQQYQAGETKTINLPITGTTKESELKGSCSITAQDSENPSNSASGSVNTCVQGIVICNKGETRCNGLAKEICTLGTGWDVVNLVDASCQGQVTPKTDDNQTNYGVYIFGIVFLISAIVSFLYFNSVIPIKNKKWKYIAVIILTLVVSGLLAFVLTWIAGAIYKIFTAISDKLGALFK